MEIKNFAELTDFLADEYSKLSESYGVQTVPDKIVDDINLMLVKYVKLYSKPLFNKAKRDLALQEAIDTMPHSFLWKLFHPSLWAKIKELENEETHSTVEEKKEEHCSCVVEVVSPPAVVHIEE